MAVIIVRSGRNILPATSQPSTNEMTDVRLARGRPGDYVQARRSRPSPVACGERAPPRRPSSAPEPASPATTWSNDPTNQEARLKQRDTQSTGLDNFPIDDPLRARYAEFASANSVVILAIEAFMALMYAAILATNLSLGVDITGAVTILVGLLFAAIGAVLDQFRPNWFVGIRTPWTLSSERAWVATHHGERPVFVVMGAALVLAGLTQSPLMLYAAISICILGMLGLVAYSFVVWRQDPSHHRLTWRVVLPATALQ